MKRPFSLGDLVRFKTTTGQFADGVVIHRIVEKRQPIILLVECADHRRAFWFQTELTLIAPAEGDESSSFRAPRFEGRWRCRYSRVPARTIDPSSHARPLLRPGQIGLAIALALRSD